MVPPRRPPKLLVPRDATATERQGQGIGDTEAMRQMATRAIPEALSMTPGIGEAMSLYEAGRAAANRDAMGTALGLAGAIPFAGTVGRVGAKAGKAGSKVVSDIVERIPNLWHGTAAGPFPKFLREFFGRGSGGNRLGVAPYGTVERMPEGLNYVKALTGGAPSNLVTNRGNVIDISPELATQLRAGEQTVEGYIDELRNTIARNEEIARGAAIDSPFRGTATRAVESDHSKLYDMLTARDEGVAEIRRPGTLMEFVADIDPQKILQYDKDLIDQTPFVQEAMRSVLGIRGSISPRRPDQMMDFSRFLRTSLPDPKGTAKLESAGIQGVAGRSVISTGSKPMNYAIFDPDRISILRHLGIAGLLGGGAAAFRPSGEQPLAPSNRMR